MDLLGEILKFIFVPQSEIAKAVNNVIIVVSAGILLWIVFYTCRIMISYSRLKKWTKYVKSQDDGILTKEKIEELKTAKGFKNTWLANKLGVINKLQNDTHATIGSIDNIDDHLRWNAFGILKYPIGSLIIFGLFGTVWGLQKAIYSIMPTIKDQLDLDSLRIVMVGTLKGMETAFSTTLAGLMASLVLGFVISFVLKGYLNRYISDTKEFLVETIVPIYSPAGSDNIETLSIVNKELRSNIERLSKQSNILFQPIVESANKLTSGIDVVFQSSQISGKSIEMLSNALSGNLNHLSNSLKEVGVTIDTYNSIQTNMEESLKNINKIPEQFTTFADKLAQQFKKHQEKAQQENAKTIGSHLVTLTESVKTMSGLVNQWKEETSKSNTLWKDEADKSLDHLKKAIDQSINKLTEKIGGILKEVEGTSNKISESNASVEKTLRYVRDTNEEQYKSIHEALNKFIETAQTNQDYKHKQIIDAISDWTTHNMVLAKLLEKLQDLPDDMSKKLKFAFKKRSNLSPGDN